MLLSAIDSRLGPNTELASCIRDQRQAGKGDPEVAEPLSKRILGMALAYADCNGAARSAH